MTVKFITFGFRHHDAPACDLLLDCRSLPNPHGKAEFDGLTGQNPAVQAFVAENPEAQRIIQAAADFIRSRGDAPTTIAFACTGGKQRSVAIAELVRARTPSAIEIEHTELAA